MPAGNQSLIPLTPTPFTSVSDGTTYKGNIDACLSVLGGIAGANYVYPGTGLQVLVDTSFIVCKNGTGIVDQRAGSPTPVALVAPGSNSYWATIYINTQTNVVGVIYGASGVTPTQMLPNSIRLVPIAFVLIATGQTTIAATNILDARGALLPDDSPIVVTGGSGNINVPTFGASKVDININLTTSMTMQLQQVRSGCQIFIEVVNTSGSTWIFQMNAVLADGVTVPGLVGYLIGGTAYTRTAIASSSASFTIPTANRYVFNCFASETSGIIIIGQF
jgi:hypothetical protein